MTGGDAAVAPFAGLLVRPADQVAADLDAFVALLGRWQRVQNLVSRETLDDVWSRHVVDSLQLLPLLRESDRIVVDLGSGGGFPALPLAIAGKSGPRRFHLVEPNGRKASFLKAVARELGLDAIVLDRRADGLATAGLPPVDLFTSRALAPLRTLCAMVRPSWGPGARALFHKGGEHAREIAECTPHWQFDMIRHPSLTDPSGVILELSSLRARS